MTFLFRSWTIDRRIPGIHDNYAQVDLEDSRQTCFEDGPKK